MAVEIPMSTYFLEKFMSGVIDQNNPVNILSETGIAYILLNTAFITTTTLGIRRLMFASAEINSAMAVKLMQDLKLDQTKL